MGMILARSPLRISLGGGGTDLPSYYEKYGGFLISAAINKYVYVSILRPFEDGIYLKYSQSEKCKNVHEIRHPIIRETFLELGLSEPKIEITTLADIPSGTGLGSSGSFTTALIKGLCAFYKKPMHYPELAEIACHVELNRLNEPIGKQDQYIAAKGGVTAFEFCPDGSIVSEAVPISESMSTAMQDRMLLFFTGFSRSASSLLRDQDQKSRINDAKMLENLHHVKELGKLSYKCLSSGDIEQYGLLMHDHWQYKKARSPGMSNSTIDSWYNIGVKNGALGGKVVGAGGGGFLLFVANDPDRLRRSMLNLGLQEVRFEFDYQGTQVVLSP